MQVYELNIDRNRKEVIHHGTFEFPIAVYHTVLKKNVLGFVNWHWHEELQFCYVTKGTVTIFLNRRTIELKEGEGIFINSGILHMTKDLHSSDGTFVCIDFSHKLISSFPNSVFRNKYVMPIIGSPQLDAITLTPNIKWQNDILKELSAVYDTYSSAGFGYEFDICSSLNKIWKTLLVNCVFDKQVNESDHGTADKEKIFALNVYTDDKAGCAVKQYKAHISNRRLKSILTYIEDHYWGKITLTDISQHIHLSANECCRFFKRNMDCTLFEYLLEYRIAKSMELLQTTDTPIGQIAYETGFGSSSYYIEKFRKKTGVTPREFRKRGQAWHGEDLEK